jgi:cobalt-zinc-cadmium resistance protein CzcA
VLGATLALIGVGLYSFSRLDIEAYPNPLPPMVEVIVQPPGWNAEEVERYVTIPLEIGLAGMPSLQHVRSQSLFGLSDVKCYFGWDTTFLASRQEVINRLQFITLPSGLQAQLSPWSPIGEIFRYTVEGPDYSLMERKTAQDWILERQFKQVPGVIDVVSFGGETKQFQVGVDPYRLRGYGVSLNQLTSAIQNANQNVGGQRLTLGEQSYTVRGVGMLRDVPDIDDVVITAEQGTPVRVRDVAASAIGAAPRLGIVGKDDDADVVQGTILMRPGAQTLETIMGIRNRVDFIRGNHLLPPGMDIRPYDDRGDLVRATTHTVLENVALGILLVSAVLFLFLGHAWPALITAVTIPLALLVAFTGLVLTGTSANLISLGAIDFGIVVDSAVIMTENVMRHLGSEGHGSLLERIQTAAGEVSSPMAFSKVVIAVSFIPLFTLTGAAGVIFAPMARTYALAIAGAVVLALTLTPVLSERLLTVGMEEREGVVMRGLRRLYLPLFGVALRRPWLSLASVAATMAVCAALWGFVGGEFMPKLEEGNLWIRATLPTSIALEQSEHYVGRMRRIVRGCPTDEAAPCAAADRRHPEVRATVSQLGRPDDGTDVAGFSNIELFAPLEPFDQWPRGLTKDELVADLSSELHDAFPGVVFNFSQAISDNVEEAIAGVKGENSVKVVGPDLVANETNAQRIMGVLSQVPGVRDLGVFSSLGQPSIRITPLRRACARYGLNTGDVTALIRAAIGGEAVTQIFQGEKEFDLVVRLLPEYRGSIEAMRETTVTTPQGMHVALGDLASFEIIDGPSTIYREDGQRYSPVKFSVRGRDLAGTVREAQEKARQAVQLPYDTHLDWSGELDELRSAIDRLAVILPITLLAIVFLTRTGVGNWRDTAIVLFNIPIAWSGGILALLLTGTHLSVSAGMGFISILGVAVQDAMLVVTYFQRLTSDAGLDTETAAREAAEKRLRAVLMTTLVAMLGLLPAAVSHGIGAQAQKPLAIVVIGGALALAVLSRVAQPPLLALAHAREE